MVSYVATANDASLAPAMLRDGFRIVRMATPGLQHLPALAANIENLARHDDLRFGDAPLALR